MHSLGLDIGSDRASYGSAEWNPASLSSQALAFDYDARKGITLASSLIQTPPSSGPAITLSGGGGLGPFTAVPGEIWIWTRDDVTFDYSLNGGRDLPGGVNGFPIPKGGTFTPAATERWANPPVFNFPSATYALRAYVGHVLGVQDSSGNGHHLVQRPASAGFAIGARGRTSNVYGRNNKGIIGRTGLISNGANYLQCLDSMALAIFGGVKSFDNFFVVSIDFRGASAQTFASASHTGATNPYITFAEAGSTAHVNMAMNSDTNTVAAAAEAGVNDSKVHVVRFCYNHNTTRLRIERDGVEIANVVAARSTANNINGYMIGALLFGSGVPIQPAFMSWSRNICYAGVLTDSDALIATQQLSNIHDVYPPRPVRFTADGDSYIAQNRSELSYVNLLTFGNDTITLYNGGVTGSSMANVLLRTAAFDANYSAGAYRNIGLLQCGVNDLSADGSGNEGNLRANKVSWITGRRTAAPGIKIITTTLIQCGASLGVPPTANYLQKMSDHNAWLLSGGSGADYVVDLNALFVRKGYTPSDNFGYQDYIHPSWQGASEIAGEMIEPKFREALG